MIDHRLTRGSLPHYPLKDNVEWKDLFEAEFNYSARGSRGVATTVRVLKMRIPGMVREPSSTATCTFAALTLQYSNGTASHPTTHASKPA